MKKQFKQPRVLTDKTLTFARLVVALMGVSLLAICGILFPELAREEAISNPNASSAVPYLLAIWVMATPIFVALYQTIKLLKYIEIKQAFTPQSMKALRSIRYCAAIFIALVITGALTMRVLAMLYYPEEDMAPVFTIGFLLTFVTSIIATFVAVVESLFAKVMQMKEENDLTI